MKFLRSLSKILVMFPLGFFLYDIIYFWFVKAKVKVRNVQELWTDIDKVGLVKAQHIFELFLTPKQWTSFSHWPAPLAMLIIPVVLYLIYRLMFLLSGGAGSDAYRYKSRD